MKEVFQIPDEMRKHLELISAQRDRLEKDMAIGNSIADKGGPNRDHIYAAKELASAYATLGRELRQWTGHVNSNIDKMTPAKKAQVMIQFFQGLPLGVRRDLYAVLVKLEEERPDGLVLSVSDRFGAAPAQVEDAAE